MIKDRHSSQFWEVTVATHDTPFITMVGPCDADDAIKTLKKYYSPDIGNSILIIKRSSINNAIVINKNCWDIEVVDP